MDDELRYWNDVNASGADKAYLAYLDAFPDGVFSDIARKRLADLVQRVKQEPKLAACEPPKAAKQPAKKAEPSKPKQPIQLLKPVKPKPKPKPVVEKTKKKPPTRVNRPRPPREILEEEPPVFEEDIPEIELPPRRRPRFPRFPRFPIPQQEDPCPNGDCAPR